jgi:hypothetical protein
MHGGLIAPGMDRQPGLLRLSVCTSWAEGSGKQLRGNLNMQVRRYWTCRQQSTVQRGAVGSFHRTWRTRSMLSLVLSLRPACRARLFDNGSVRRQHHSVAATHGPLVCCTLCVFGCGAQRFCAEAAAPCLYSQTCCKASHRSYRRLAHLLCSPYLTGWSIA